MDFSWEGAGPPKTLHHNIFMSGVEPAGSFLNISIYPNIPSTSTLPESANYTGRKRRQETGDAAAEKKLKDCKPDMNSLMYLSTEDGVLKIVEESAIKYRQIGFILLKDKGGSRVNTLTESNPVGAVREIYNHWITEDEDYSWSKLAQCLRECELNVLAHKIEKHFGLTPPQQGQEGTSTNAQRKRTRSKQERTDDTKKRKKS
jgi:hypothetical protein